MRRMLAVLAVLAVVTAGVIGCSSTPQITDTALGFAIVEGLLILKEDDATLGTALVSSTGGNCSSFQQGLNPANILGTDFLTFNLQVQDPVGAYLPLTAGTYTIVMAPQPGAGNFAGSIEYETMGDCALTATGGNSGTVTVQPFAVDAGATSTVTYSVVFAYSRFKGSYPLTTCVVPATATAPDAGVCVLPGSGPP
jgi:hypothetical protein